MANIKSQIKRNRQNEALRQRNLAVRSELRTFARRFREALASGDRAKAEAALQRACRAYDRAAAKGVVHKSNAANHKSRLSKAFNSAGSAA
ncbi:MAG: 30S ribosomal protein S20 [Acidobacteria bacterium]|nr:30S ribosomal protein S20 [Acidobacteriota bacterium]